MATASLTAADRDFMQQDAADLGLGVAEMLGDVPGDSLAFAVRVAGEIDVVLALRRRLLISPITLSLPLITMIVGREIMLDIDPKLALGQVHDMADRGHDLVIATRGNA